MAQFGSETNPAGENTAVPEPPSPEQLMAQMAALVEKMAAMQLELDAQKLKMRGIGKAQDEDGLEYTPPAAAVQRLFASEPAAMPASFLLTPQRRRSQSRRRSSSRGRDRRTRRSPSSKDSRARGQAAAAPLVVDDPRIAGGLPSAAPAPKFEDLHCPTEPGLGREQWGSRQLPLNQASASWGGPGASWAQQGWVDFGGGVAPPPQNPPGIADPLANPLLDPWSKWTQAGEKSGDEAKWAEYGWIDRSKAIQAREAWCTPTQWRGDWQQCMPAQFSDEPRGVWGVPLPDLDKKDIEKPEKYSGDISGWIK